MATAVDLGGSGTFFRGEDKILEIELFSSYDPITDTGTLVDASGWPSGAVHWVVKRSPQDTSDPIIDLTASITGTFDSVRATNAQRAVVTLTSALSSLLTLRGYAHAWKRTDAGNATVLCAGALTVEHSTADDS